MLRCESFDLTASSYFASFELA